MRVLITGGTNGMGKGVARALAARDPKHEIIILGRSAERGESTLRELRSVAKNPNVSFVCCDLTKLSDVKNAIARLRASTTSLDAVFINAGLGYAAGRYETEDGLDPHFQVNYLSQFMLTLQLLDLLERSQDGGRVVFNVTEGGHIVWDALQLKRNWGYERGIQQAMVAKRMFYARLHDLTRKAHADRTSFFGFQIPKTVWSNQINIIPWHMRAIATVVKWFGGFISIDECGELMAPLFTEDQAASRKRSGTFVTRTKLGFVEKDDPVLSDRASQEKLWNISLDLCQDEDTRHIAAALCQRAQSQATSAPS